MSYWVYILASEPGGTLYIGVTNNLIRRIHQHKTGEGSAFVRKYGVVRLVYAEEHRDIADAIAREKRLKRWRRAWKLRLIQSTIRIGPIYMTCMQPKHPHAPDGPRIKSGATLWWKPQKRETAP